MVSIHFCCWLADNLFIKAELLCLIQLPCCPGDHRRSYFFCSSGISSGDENWSIFFPGKVVNFPPVTSHTFQLVKPFSVNFLPFFRLIRSDLISTINKNYTHKHADFDRFAKIFTTFFSLSAHVCHTRAAARIGRYYLCKIFASLTFLFYFCFSPKWLRTVWPFRLGYLFSLSLLTF